MPIFFVVFNMKNKVYLSHIVAIKRDRKIYIQTSTQPLQQIPV